MNLTLIAPTAATFVRCIVLTGFGALIWSSHEFGFHQVVDGLPLLLIALVGVALIAGAQKESHGELRAWENILAGTLFGCFLLATFLSASVGTWLILGVVVIGGVAVVAVLIGISLMRARASARPE